MSKADQPPPPGGQYDGSPNGSVPEGDDALGRAGTGHNPHLGETTSGDMALDGSGALVGDSALDAALSELNDTDFLGESGPFIDTSATSGSSNGQPDPTIVVSLDARDGAELRIADLSYIYDGTFVRQGSDLLLVKPDGTAILIENYFAVEMTPDLVGDGGRRVTAELIDSFLMPVARGQTASLSDHQVAQAQGEPIGTVENLTGTVTAVRADGTVVELSAGDPVFQGDQIVTADGGSVKITFIDNTIFTLGSDARLALDEMVFNPATQSGESAFSILKGGFLFVSGQIAETNPNDMTVNTPVATIGIRGTIVTGEVAGLETPDGETFRFTVVDGEIAVTAGESTIILSDNFATVSGQRDENGQTRVFEFLESPQNVVARNSRQFSALSDEDVAAIEQAIERTIQEQTGQENVDIDLRGLIDAADEAEEDGEDDADQGEEGGEDEEDTGDAGENAEEPEEEVAEEDEGGEEVVEEVAEEIEEELTEEELASLETEGDGEDGDGGGDDGDGDDGDDGDGDGDDDGDDGDTTGSDNDGDADTADDGGNDETEDEEQVIRVTNPDGGGTEVPGSGGANGLSGGITGGSQQSEGGTTQGDTEADDDIVLSDGGTVDGDSAGNTGLSIGTGNLVNGVANFSSSTQNITANFASSSTGVQVTTGSGDDNITGSANNDVINAGAGDDTIVGGHGGGDDQYDGGDGADTLTFDSVTGENTANLTVTLADPSGTTTISDGGAEITDNDTVTGIEHIRLGDGADTVTVNGFGVDVDGDVGVDRLVFSQTSSMNLTSGDSVELGEGNQATGDTSTFTNFEIFEFQDGGLVSGGTGGETIVVGSNESLAGTVTIGSLELGEAATIATNGDFTAQRISSSGTTSVLDGLLNLTEGTMSFQDMEVLSVRGTFLAGANTDLGESGTLSIENNGTFAVTGGQVFNHDNGSSEVYAELDFGTGATIGGAGTFRNAENFTANGLTLADGASFDNNARVSIGSNGFDIEGTFDNDSGTLAFGTGATLTLDTGGTTTLGGTINLGGGNEIEGASAADALAITGTLNSTNSANVAEISVDLTVTETGTIVIGGDEGTDGTLIISGAFTNDGHVHVDPVQNANQNGVLRVTQDFTNTGTLQVDNAATLNVGSGDGVLTNTGTLIGTAHAISETGVIEAGTIVNTGVVSLPGSPGGSSTLTFKDLLLDNTDGDVEIGLEAAAIFDGSELRIGQDGTLTTGGNASVKFLNEGATLNLAHDDVTITNQGAFTLASGAVLAGDGTFENLGDMTLDGVTIAAGARFENDEDSEVSGAISLTNTGVLTVNGTLVSDEDATVTIADGGIIAGTGTFSNSGTMEASGVTIDTGATYEGDVTFDDSAQFKVDGTFRGGVEAGGEVASSIGGSGSVDLTSGTISGSGIRLSTSVDVTQSGELAFGNTAGVLSVVGSDWVLGDGASFADSNGTLSINAGSRLGVASGAAFSYDSTAQTKLNLSVAGDSELFGDGAFTIAAGSSLTPDDDLTISVATFSNLGTLATSSNTISFTGDDVTNTGTIEANGATSIAKLSFDGTHTLGGIVELNNNGAAAKLESTNGSLTITGELISQDPTSARDTSENQLFGTIVNQGIVGVDHDLNVAAGAVLDSRDGTLSVEERLEANGEIILGADSTITGDGSIQIKNGGSLSVAADETFTFASSDGTTVSGGTEAILNDGSGTFVAPDVSTLSNGNYVTVWTDTTADQVYFEIRSADGNEVVATTAVDSGEAISSGRVTALSGGGFAVMAAYDDNGTTTLAFKVFENDGTARTSLTDLETVQANTDIDNFLERNDIIPNGDGFAAIRLIGNDNVRIHRLEADGTQDELTGSTILTMDGVNSVTTSALRGAELSNGNLIAVVQETEASRIYLYAANATGDPIIEPGQDGATAILSSSINSGLDVAALTNGQFVTTWGDADGNVHAQINSVTDTTDPAGVNTVKAAFQVNTTTSGTQDNPSVTVLSDGGFVIAYENSEDDGVLAQRFDASGNTIGSEFAIPSSTGASHDVPALTALANGDFAAVYEDGSDISTRIFETSAGEAAVSLDLQSGSAIAGTGVFRNEKTITASGSVELESGATVQNAGKFTQAPGTLEINGTFENQTAGVLTAEGGVISVASNASFSNAGTLSLEGHDSDAELVLNGDATNSGTLILDNQSGSMSTGGTITANGGAASLLNSGEIKVLDSESGNPTHRIIADVENTGTLTLQGNLRFGAVEGGPTLTLDSSAGKIDVAARLEASGEIILGADTSLSGDGTIQVKDGGSLSVADGETFTLSASSDGSTALTFGEEITPHTSTAGTQEAPQGAALSNGNVAVIWDDAGVTLRVVDGTGTPVSSQDELNSTVVTDNGAITALDGGGFVVAGTFEEQRDIGNENFEFVTVQGFQRYDNAGAAQGSFVEVNEWYVPGFDTHALTTMGSGFVVVSADDEGNLSFNRYASDGTTAGLGGTTSDSLNGYTFDGVLQATELSNGNVAVLYNEGSGLHLVIINDLGAEIISTEMDEFDLGASNAASFDLGAIADGDLIITWETSGGDIMAQRVDVTGTLSGTAEVALNGAAFTVNTETSGTQSNPSITTHADGSYTIAYETTGNDGILVQRFDASGTKIGTETTVNEGNGASHDKPFLVGFDDGDFAVLYEDGGDVSMRFTASSSESGGATSTVLDASGADPEIAVLQNGNVVAVWEDGSDIAGRVINPDTGATVQSFTIASNVGGGDLVQDPVVETMSDGTFRVAYVFNSSTGGDMSFVGTSLFNADGTANTAHAQTNLSLGGTIKDLIGIAAMDDGEFGLAVHKDDQTNIQYLDAGGNTLSGNNVGGGGTLTGAFGIGGGAGDQFMTARISVSGASELINVLAYDDTGQTINATIASEDTGTFGDSVDATFLTNGNYVVAYIKNDQPVFQVRDSASATVVSATVVEASMTAGDSISVEPTTGGGFRVTWTADSGGDTDIFSQLFDSAGNASGAMETITATGADATSLDTAILSDGSGVSVHVEGGQVILTTGSDTGSGATTTPSVELQNGATIGGSGVLVNESEIGSDGTVAIASDATLRNAGTFTQASGVLEIDGTFDNQAEGTLLATGDIELASGATLSNAGIIRATDGAEITLSSTNIDNTGGTIEIIGGASSSELHIRDNITLGGVLHLSEDDSGQDNDADITVSNGDTLTITGTLRTSTESDPGTNDHDIYGDYVNQGTFSLDHHLHLNSGGLLDTSDGLISLSNNTHLDVDGDLLVGTDTTLTGQGTVVIYDDLRVGNGESFTHSGGVQLTVDGGELDGSGTFTNQGTIVFGTAEGTMSTTGSISANIFDNLGLIQVQGGTLLVETDGFENASVGIEGATGTIELKASSDTAVLKLDEDFDNSGLIDLAGDFSDDHARITHHGNETLTNQGNGTIQVSGGEVTGDRVFDVDIENLGLVAVGANATLTSGHVLDTSSGTVSIQTSQELDARGTVLVGDNTDFQGSGTIDFGSLGALSLADDEVYTYDPAALTLDFSSGGTIKGDGTLRNDGELELSGAEIKDGTFDNNGTLELTGAHFQNGVIDNDGTILIDGTTSTTLAATSFDNTGGLIDMRSDEGDSTLVLADDLTVTGGVLSLDAWAGGNDTAYLDVGAHTLTMDGTLLSKSTDGDVDDANVLTGTGEVINTGTIDVDIDLRVASDMTLDAKDAQVDVATGASLDVNGVLEVGDDTVFSGDGTVRVGSGAELEVATGEVFTYGQISFATHVLDADIGGAYDVKIVDLDGDGDMDLVGAAQSADEILWYENDGDEGFTEHTVAALNDVRRIFIEDVNGDGNLDILAASRGNNATYWFENDGSEGFTSNTIGGSSLPFDIVAADFDKDNEIEVLVAANGLGSSHSLPYYENDGDENFTESNVDTDLDNDTALAIGDINNDGNLDFVVADYNNEVRYYQGDGAGNFSSTVVASGLGSLWQPYSVDIADIDGDGFGDIVVTTFEGNQLQWYAYDNASGSFTRHVIDSGLDGAFDAVAADFDGDGDQDIIASAGDDKEIIFYENDGTGTFTKLIVDDDFEDTRALATGDIDGDGDQDFAAAGFGDGVIHWYENLNGEATPEINLATGATLSGTGTFQNAGTLDLSGAVLDVAKFDNDGTVRFEEEVRTLALASFDNDGGRLELLSGDVNGAEIVIAASGTLGGDVLMDTSDNDDTTISVASGETLTLTGTLITEDSAAANTSHELIGTVVHTGTIDLNQDLRVQTYVDVSDATIDVGAGAVLDVQGSLLGGDATSFGGAGTIDVRGEGVVSVESGETLDLGTVSLDLAANAELAGTGTIRLGATDTDITDATIAVSTLENDGTTTMQDGVTVFSGSEITGDGTLQLQSGPLTPTMRLVNDLTNASTHTIAMIDAGGTIDSQTGATLTNAGVISFGSTTVGDSHSFQIDVINTGTIDVDGHADVFSGNTLNSVDGAIDIASGQTLSTTGTIVVGTDTDLTGDGTLELSPNGELEIATGETFTLGVTSVGDLSAAVTANTSSGLQNNPDIAVLSDGSFWVAWDNHSDLQDEIALFNADGTATGTILTVNDGNDFPAESVKVSTYGASDDVVAAFIVDDGAQTFVNFNTFDSAGNPGNSNGTAITLNGVTGASHTVMDLTDIGGVETEKFLTAITTNGTLTTGVTTVGGSTTTSVLDSSMNGEAGVAAVKLNNGNAVVAYLDENGATDNVIARIVDDTNSVVATVTVGATTVLNQIDVAALTNGNFAVSWTDGTDTFASIFDNEGDAVGATHTLTSGAFDTEIAAGADGGFMGILDTGAGIFQSSYDSEGTLLSSTTVVSDTVSVTDGAEIAHLGDGRFVVAYGDSRVGSGDILVRSTGSQVVELNLGTQSVTGAGTLAIAADYDLDIAAATLAMGGLDNDGTISIDAATGHFDTGTITGDGTIVVTSDTSGRGTLGLDSDLTNAAGHTIALSSGVDGASALYREIRGLTGGVKTLTNEGVITSENASGNDLIRSDIVNTGSMILGNGANLTQNLDLDTSAGTITMSSESFTVEGQLTIGTATDLSGDFRALSTGSIILKDSETFTHDFSTVTFDMRSGGSIAGTGTLVNTGSWDELQGGTLASGVTFDNDGTVAITDGTVTVETANLDNAGGTISLIADEGEDPTLLLNTTVTNAGLIHVQLDTSGQGADNGEATIGGTGTLTNTGTISIEHGTLDASDPADVALDVGIVNTGLVSIEADTAISAELDTADGTIVVNNDGLNEVDVSLFVAGGTLTVGADSRISGSGELAFSQSGELNLTAGETFHFGAEGLSAAGSATTVADSASAESGSQVVRLSTGDYWVAFHDAGDKNYKFQRYDAAGTAQGGAVVVNTNDDAADTPEYRVTVTSDDNVIFWVKEDNNGDPVLRQYVYDSTGSGSQAGFPSGADGTGAGVFGIGTYETNGNSGYIGSYVEGGNLSIREHASNGGFSTTRNVETSFSTISETHITGLKNGSTDIVHAYIKDGELIVRTYVETLHNSSLNANLGSVSVSEGISLAALTGGGFAVSYGEFGEVGLTKVAVYDASQSLVTTVTLGASFSFSRPEMTALSDGGFAALYTDDSGNLVVRTFNASGTEVGSATTVQTNGFGSLSDYALVADDAGGFAVSYVDDQFQSDDVFLKFVSSGHDAFTVEFSDSVIGGTGTLGVDAGQSFDLAGATVENGAHIDNDGSLTVDGGTLTLESDGLDNADGTISIGAAGAIQIQAGADVVNAGELELSSTADLIIDGTGGSRFSVGPSGTLTANEGADLRLDNGAVFANGGLIALVASGFSPALAVDSTSGGGTLVNTGKIDFSSTATVLELGALTTLSLQSGTEFTGAVGGIELRAGAELAIDHDVALTSGDFIVDTIGIEFGHAVIGGTGTLTNAGFLDHLTSFKLDGAAFVNQTNLDVGDGTISTAFTNAAGAHALTLSSSDTLTLEDRLTNNGTFSLGGGDITGGGTLANAGLLELSVSSNREADLSGVALENTGTIVLESLDGTSHGTLTVASAFTNQGTISFVAVDNGDTMTLKLGSAGSGTLTNDGVITSEEMDVADVINEPFSIDGNVVAGTTGGTIFVAEYDVSGPEVGSIRISGDLTQTNLSKTIIETGAGLSNTGAVLSADGTVTYGGTFELRISDGFSNAYKAVDAGSSAGTLHRVDVLNADGTEDFASTTLGKLVIPELIGGDFSIGLADADTVLSVAGTLVGSSGADLFAGSDGADVIGSGSGGGDVLFGMGGDDRFTLSHSNADYVDGGDGTDVLYVETESFGQNDAWRFNNFEALDVSGIGPSGTVAITQDFAFGITEDTNALVDGLAGIGALADNALVVAGDSGQTLRLTDDFNWTATGTTVTVDHDGSGTDSYQIYSADNGANVFVDTDMTVQTGLGGPT